MVVVRIDWSVRNVMKRTIPFGRERLIRHPYQSVWIVMTHRMVKVKK
jgi:hypothetical protein